MKIQNFDHINNTINTPAGIIEYSSTGKGMPILFLHGGHSNCRETLFHKGFDKNKHRLITPSRPGYGNTPLDNSKTPEDAAKLIIALLDQLELDKVIVYGISAGGLTAIALAANYPERVEKLVLASAVTKKWLDKNGKVYKAAKKLFNPIAEKAVWGMIRFFSGIMPGIIAKQFYPQFTKNASHPLAKEDIGELTRTFKHYSSGRGFMNDIDQNIDQGLLKKIQAPTLIIHSKNDNSVDFEHATNAHNSILNSKLIPLDNEWGHLFWLGSDSKKSIRKAIEFIEE